MSHFAQVKDGIVTNVIVAEQDWINTLPDAADWIQTSYNTQGGEHLLGGTPLRGNYAGVGMIYDKTNDVFYHAQPYPSWTLNTTTWRWESPVPIPEDHFTNDWSYTWDEETRSWINRTPKHF
jgi:hypothetical protein